MNKSKIDDKEIFNLELFFLYVLYTHKCTFCHSTVNKKDTIYFVYNTGYLLLWYLPYRL